MGGCPELRPGGGVKCTQILARVVAAAGDEKTPNAAGGVVDERGVVRSERQLPVAVTTGGIEGRQIGTARRGTRLIRMIDDGENATAGDQRGVKLAVNIDRPLLLKWRRQCIGREATAMPRIDLGRHRCVGNVGMRAQPGRDQSKQDGGCGDGAQMSFHRYHPTTSITRSVRPAAL